MVEEVHPPLVALMLALAHRRKGPNHRRRECRRGCEVRRLRVVASGLTLTGVGITERSRAAVARAPPAEPAGDALAAPVTVCVCGERDGRGQGGVDERHALDGTLVVPPDASPPEEEDRDEGREH